VLKSLLCAAALAFPMALSSTLLAAADSYLLMAEEDGCYWCARWDKEISQIYPKTPEGKAAPLKRYDLRGETPDVDFKQRVTFTPTFIVVSDGKEVNRLEGYPGEDFFWGLLSQMLSRAGINLGEAN
jgi:hypothetical protein